MFFEFRDVNLFALEVWVATYLSCWVELSSTRTV